MGCILQQCGLVRSMPSFHCITRGKHFGLDDLTHVNTDCIPSPYCMAKTIILHTAGKCSSFERTVSKFMDYGLWFLSVNVV